MDSSGKQSTSGLDIRRRVFQTTPSAVSSSLPVSSPIASATVPSVFSTPQSSGSSGVDIRRRVFGSTSSSTASSPLQATTTSLLPTPKPSKPVEDYFKALRSDSTNRMMSDADLMKQAEARKKKEDEKNKIGMYDMLGSSTLQAPTTGDTGDVVANALNIGKEFVGKPLMTLLDILNRPQNALYGAMEAVAKGKGIEGAKEQAWKGLTKQEDYFNLLERLGLPKGQTAIPFADWQIPILKDFVGNVSDRDLMQFGLDVISDPLNLLFLGPGKGAKTAIEIGEKAITETGEQVAKKTAITLTEQATKQAAKLAQSAMETMRNKVIKQFGENGWEKLAQRAGKTAPHMISESYNELFSKEAQKLFDKFGNKVIDKGGIGIKVPFLPKVSLVSGETLGQAGTLARKLPVIKQVSNAAEDLKDAAKSLFAYNPFQATREMGEWEKAGMKGLNKIAETAPGLVEYTSMRKKLLEEALQGFEEKIGKEASEKLTRLMEDPAERMALMTNNQLNKYLLQNGIVIKDKSLIEGLRQFKVMDAEKLGMMQKAGVLVDKTPFGHFKHVPVEEIMKNVKKGGAMGEAVTRDYVRWNQLDPLTFEETGKYIMGSAKEHGLKPLEKYSREQLFDVQMRSIGAMPLEGESIIDKINRTLAESGQKAIPRSEYIVPEVLKGGKIAVETSQQKVARAVASIEGRIKPNANDFNRANVYLDMVHNPKGKWNKSVSQIKEYQQIKNAVGKLESETVGSFDDIMREADNMGKGIYKNKKGVYFKKVDGMVADFNKAYEDGITKMKFETDLGKVFPNTMKEVGFWRANTELLDWSHNAGYAVKIGGKDGIEAIPEGWRRLRTKNLTNIAAPMSIADAWDKFNQSYFFSDKATNMLLRTLDKATNFFKKTALMTLPGAIPYNARNFFNNNWAMYLGDVNIPKTTTLGLAIMSGKKNFKIAGKTVSEILDEMALYGLSDLTHLRDIDLPSSAKKGLLDKIPVAGGIIKGVAGEWGANASQKIEGLARLQTYIDGLMKGMPPEQAAMRVKKLLFQYNDLSAFEKNLMKRIFPFYTFTRKNIPLQLEILLKHPEKFNKIGTAMRFLQNTSANAPMTKEELDAVPDYIWNYNPFFLGKPGKRYFLSMDGFLSATDYAKPLSPVDTALEMFHPYAKVPVENVINYDFYLKKQIKDVPGARDEFLGQSVDPTIRKALSVFRPIADINRMNPGDIFGKREEDAPEMVRYFGSLSGVKPKAIDLAKSGKSGLAAAKRNISLLTSKYNEAKTDAERQHWVYEIQKVVKENGGDVLAIMNSSIDESNQLTQRELDAKIRKAQLKRGTP